MKIGTHEAASCSSGWVTTRKFSACWSFAGQDGPACHASAQSLSLSRQVAKASSTRSGKEQSTGRKQAKEISTQEAGDGWIPGGKLTGGVVGTLLSGAAGGGVLLEIRGVGRR